MEGDIKTAIFELRNKYPKDRITPKLKEELDALIASPADRANKVLELIREVIEKNEVDQYDIICFCSAYLLGMLPIYKMLGEEVLEIQTLILYYHYLVREEQ